MSSLYHIYVKKSTAFTFFGGFGKLFELDLADLARKDGTESVNTRGGEVGDFRMGRQERMKIFNHAV